MSNALPSIRITPPTAATNRRRGPRTWSSTSRNPALGPVCVLRLCQILWPKGAYQMKSTGPFSAIVHMCAYGCTARNA